LISAIWVSAAAILLGASSAKITDLSFSEFFEYGPRELKPSATLLSLNGHRVRMVGFMAQMEMPPEGAFYLTPHPVSCDEEGAGTSDLPVSSVRVVVRSAKGKTISFIPSPVEVTGVLELGYQADDEGRVSAIRLILDNPDDWKRSHKKSRVSSRGIIRISSRGIK